MKSSRSNRAEAIAHLLSSDHASVCMSTPVKTIVQHATLADAKSAFLRYGHNGLCVLDSSDQLVGMLSRRDVDIALHHGRQEAQVLTCMSTPVRAITPQTSLSCAYQLMVSYDIGRLPVLRANRLVGIITRSDLLRQFNLAVESTLPLARSKPATVQSTSTDNADKSHAESSNTRSNAPHSAIASKEQRSLPAPTQLYNRLKVRSGPLWPALERLIEAAEDEGCSLYVVGGAVRDLLLSYLGQSPPITDIDLVVSGKQPKMGIAIASSVRADHPQFELKIYGEFQTASLSWVSEDKLTKFEIDVATARTEFYPYPAANPEVEPSTIHQDLYRRDFTINAMALRLTGVEEQSAQLLDFFGGWIALQQKQVRVIHPNSFVEDPTRIFRAVRFATRLGFSLDDYTQRLVSYAVDSSLYDQVKDSHQKAPALQSRLTAELEKDLSAKHWLTILESLNQTGALACIHAQLFLSHSLRLQLIRIARWQRQFLPKYPRWRLLLVLLIAQLDAPERSQVAKTLHLDSQSQHQLENLHRWEQDITSQLLNAGKASEIYRALNAYSRVEQLLIVARHPYTLGPQIWQHINHLSQMSPLINGGTLKRLGYVPSPIYKEILDTVHQLTLDGVLETAQAAEQYVKNHYSTS